MQVPLIGRWWLAWGGRLKAPHWCKSYPRAILQIGEAELALFALHEAGMRGANLLLINMTPDEIRTLLAAERTELHCEPLPTEGKGYSFWFGPRNPRETNRVLRVSRDSEMAPTRVKLAVNKRIPVAARRVVETESTYTGDVVWLLEQVDQEIASYLKYIGPGNEF